MSSRIQFIAIVAAILIIGAALRFHGLGTWPFAGDETATLLEETILFHGVQVSEQTQYYRLPHLIPVSYFLLHISQTLFGSDEFGSRFLMAIVGTVGIVAIFMLLNGLMERSTAIATALLVTMWPEHILQSQQARFYAVAAFFSFLAILVGAFALKRKPLLFYALSCGLAFAAMLTHTLLVVLFPMIFVGIVAGSYAQRQPVPKNLWLAFLVAAIIVAGFFGFYALQFLRGWNEGATWGYSVAHSVLASIAMIGWPIALLAMLGFLLMLYERGAQNWYWATCFFGWAVATIALPALVTYQEQYIFPLSLGALVPAGYAIGVVYKYLRPRGVLIAAGWLLLMCLSNLPSLASYYADGSRHDFRSAAEYIKEKWAPGDRVTGFSVGLVRHYAGGCCEPMIPLGSNALSKLKELTAHDGRLWIVLESGRSGLPRNLQEWLFANTCHKLEIKGKRFDYWEPIVDVYLFAPMRGAYDATSNAPQSSIE